MEHRQTTPLRQLAGFTLFAALISVIVGWNVYRSELDDLSERAEADLSFAVDRLTGQLFRYRELAVVLSRHPGLTALLEGAGDPNAARAVVQYMADMSGAADISVVDVDGYTRASSEGANAARSPAAAPLRRALDGALGRSTEIISTPNGPKRYAAFAAPVQDSTGRVIGAVMTRVAISQIEDNWPGDAPAVFFTRPEGQIFISDRSDLVLVHRATNMVAHRVTSVGPHQIWHMDAGPYLPRSALHLGRNLPALGFSAEILLDAGDTRSSALLWALVSGGVMLVFGAIVFAIQQNRRALADRLAIEAAATQRLESRVAERTLELTELNADLRREVGERKEAEAALKRAQEELVQAGKLSALGQMSAGISHELNQPLMAIRSFAENGEAFFDRGRPEVARENLGRISELARRMGRIIQNLRAFAKQESGPVTDVDLVAVIDASIEVVTERLERGQISLNWSRPNTPVIVRGGEVRLQQVVVNLLSNAIDAMSESDPREVHLGIALAGRNVSLTVRDTGPGITDPERMFDPFYSTKATGSAKGMGLGLSISYGLVQSFGGLIRGENHPDGGAVFTVDLQRANTPNDTSEETP